MVLGGGFWVQLGLHALVAGAALLAGVGIGLDGALRAGPDIPLLSVAGLVLVAGAAASIVARRRRAESVGHASGRADEADARHLAGRDALTGLVNRAVFVEHVQRVLDGARRGDRGLALLCVDIVDFGAVNDALGHAAGDLLLRHVGTRLSSVVRETDVVARLGADGFAILQSGPDGAEAAAGLAERVLGALEEPFDLHGQQTFVTARIGITLHPDDGRDAFGLLGNAALALGRAKEDGGQAYRFFDPKVDAEVRHRTSLERDLGQALERGEFELLYQPQVDVTTRRPVGVEALPRWQHPVHGWIGPDVFLPLAENVGLIGAIGAWVLDRACARGARWHEAGATALRVSIELSPAQLRVGDFAGLIEKTLGRTGFPPGCLGLRITGRAPADTAADLAALARLRAEGVRVSLADPGVGPAALAGLHGLPLDEITIERSLVRHLPEDHRAAAIVRAMLALGRDLGVPTLAEGVDTQAQLDFLVAQGCDLAQGDYFSASVSVQEIDSLVRESAAALAQPREGEVQKIA